MDNNLATRIARLSPQQLKELSVRTKVPGRGGREDQELCGLRRPGEHPPMSYAQERLWVLDQVGLSGPAYHMSVGLRLIGVLDEAALERAFNELVRRHESLRTRFEEIDGRGCQIICAGATFSIRRLSVAEVETCTNESLLEAFVRQESQRPFDLARGPLLRVCLLGVADQEHGLVLSMHHIISDGWSNGVLMRELRSLYASYSRGQPSQLGELRVQYADYALWQRKWLREEVLERQLAYWKNQLADAPAVLELPTDRPRPAVASYRGGACAVSVPKPLSDALALLARKEGTTLFMVLLAALQILLSRWSGQQDVVVGTPIAGRSHRDTEGLIGFFVNTLALRARLGEVASFRELLQQVKETALAAYANQDLPFEKLVHELAPARDLSRHPLFQVMLVLQNVTVGEFELGDLQVAEISREHATAKFDLTVALRETNDGLRGGIEYAADLFDQATIVRFADHFTRLLEQVVLQPQAPLEQLDILSTWERQRLLLDWNATQAAYPQDHCVHELFAEQARMTPHTVAVVHEGRQCTYGELDRRANQLARRLRQLGVGPETVVGLCVPRSLSMVLGMLAILKAGGAYLPIDTTLPADRIAFMLEDAEAGIVLTEDGARAALASWTGTRIPLDSDCPALDEESEPAPDRVVLPQNPAYVVYTSGTTGQPKGVMVPHRALTNFAWWAQRAYALRAPIRMSQSAAMGFDAATGEIWPPLIAGATLVITGQAALQSVTGIAEFFNSAKINVAFVVTPLVKLLAERALNIDSLRVLLTGGDALGAIAEDLPATVVNHYGPTECTIVATAGQVRGNPHIGRPLPNYQVYVLDERLDVVPTGVAGELFIGGDGLARGYLNRPSLTAQRFIASPFGAAGSRVYRTGDLVRYRADGNLEFLGRVDQQVKIRGYRIELGEVEAQLRKCPGISQAVVIDRQDRGGQKRLVGYVVLHEQQTVSMAELRLQLRQSLPEYMVPAAIVLLDQIPLTRNGKVDRLALPEPDMSSQLQLAYVAPRSRTERLLAEIWAQVLGLPRVGIHDNFFELGGDSVGSIKLISRARGAGLIIKPKDIFRHQTVATLAEVVELSDIATDVKLEAVASKTGIIPLTPVQRIFLSLWGEEISLNASTYLYVASKRIEPATVRRALEILVGRHDAFRLRVIERDGRWEQRLSSEPANPEGLCEVVDLSNLQGDIASADERIALGLQELRGRVDLQAGSLLRATLFEFGSGRPQQLALHVHHFANDALSYPILFEELQVLCQQLHQGEAPDLPAAGMPFSQWAMLTEQHIASIAVAPSAEPMQLPVDFVMGENTVASMRTLTEQLPDSLAKELVPASLRLGLMTEDLLLIALARAVQLWTGYDRVTVEHLNHGRRLGSSGVDASRSVGWFTTGVPVSLDMHGSVDRAALVEQLHNHAHRADGGGLAYWAQTARALESGMDWQPRPICLNHLGGPGIQTAHGLLKRITPPPTWTGSIPSSARRPYIIELQTAFADDTLHCAWRYSAHLHREETLRSLACHFRESLLPLVE